MAECRRLLHQNGTVAIVSHDAGGAEVLSSYVRRHAVKPVYVLDGPARKIFERKLGVSEIIPLADALERAESVLCSTSWQSDLEFRAISKSKIVGKPSVAFLDHWVNYGERFVRNNERVLPDQIWVGDSIGLKMAQKSFPGHCVHMVENPYFLEIKEEILALGQHKKSEGRLSVLYICEPVKEHARLRYGSERYWGYVEEDALRYFLNHVDVLGSEIGEVRIRPHPSEDQDKYSWAAKEFDLPITRGGERALLAEIADSDIVVGCQSMAMVVGLLASKRVISCIPPEGRRCVLPHREIEILADLLP
ncbi:hypothetical protein [Castellaniella sp. UC4442_H9]